MNLSLEFTLTAADLRQLMAGRGWRRFSLLCYVVAIFFVLLAVHRLSTSGLDWIFGLYVAFAVYLFFRDLMFISLFVAFCQFWAKRALISRVSIDEQTISIEQSKSQREIPWSSFAMTGTACELKSHFWLECGRGVVWIPKRAFPTADDMTNFRALVKEKMGERCQFKE